MASSSRPGAPAAGAGSAVIAAPEPEQDTTAAGWVCVSCRARNAMSVDRCARCGTSFSALLRGSVAARLARPAIFAILMREIVLLFSLFVLWRILSTFSVTQQHGAFTRATSIWHFERWLHIGNEAAVQRGMLEHPVIIQALNYFYVSAHVASMLALLPWLFFRHRDRYRRWRNVVIAFTGTALLVQFVSVAPPRLLPELGFVDTAARYHQSAYVHLGPGMVDQLSSMPSIHVGWAVIVALAVVSASSSRWRYAVILHPLLTAYAVVATANHFWLDSVAAVVLVVAVLLVQRRAATWWQRIRRRSVGQAVEAA